MLQPLIPIKLCLIICYDENQKQGREAYITVGDTYKTILIISDGITELLKR